MQNTGLLCHDPLHHFAVGLRQQLILPNLLHIPLFLASNVLHFYFVRAVDHNSIVHIES